MDPVTQCVQDTTIGDKEEDERDRDSDGNKDDKEENNDGRDAESNGNKDEKEEDKSRLILSNQKYFYVGVYQLAMIDIHLNVRSMPMPNAHD